MFTDSWHYPRTALAKQVLALFETGLSNALTFFAPRRMGKTEFLCKDMLPLAERRKWRVFYFSFLDAGNRATSEFTKALTGFAESKGVSAKSGGLLRRITKVSGKAAGISAAVEFSNPLYAQDNMKALIAHLATKGKVLLLLDEVQVLAQYAANTDFIAALRTVLDIHKDTVKVIFTGSSQDGLRRMFSQAKAPFFHFGQNLPFPELDKGFTDHLANTFKTVTQRKLDTDKLWAIFKDMQKVPQLARALVERAALNPTLTLEQAKQQLLKELFADRTFINSWECSSLLEQLLLHEIAVDTGSLFSIGSRKRLAKKLGMVELSVPAVQSALRVLQRRGIISRFTDRGNYFIEDPNFKSWLLQSD